MRIVVVGASGTIGRAVCAELGARHQVLRAGRTGPDLEVDMTREASIAAMYERAGAIDALACAAGHVVFAPLAELDDAKYEASLRDKLLGQVALVRLGLDHVRDGGSFTLIGGVLSRDFVVGGAAASMVNGALDAWVRAASIEMPRGIRVNLVSPTVLEDSMERFGPFFRGHEPVAARRVGLAYAKSVEGRLTGQIFVVE